MSKTAKISPAETKAAPGKSAKARPGRAEILSAALDLFSGYGFHGTSMALLAKTAKIPVGTIYRHFSGKEELIHALYLQLKQERYDAMLKSYSDDLSVRERFDLIWTNNYDYCVKHPREFVFTEQYAFSPFLRDASQAIHAIAPPELGKFYEDGYSEGMFKPLHPSVLFSLMSGPLNALVRRAIAGLFTLDDDTLRQARDACWDAITIQKNQGAQNAV